MPYGAGIPGRARRGLCHLRLRKEVRRYGSRKRRCGGGPKKITTVRRAHVPFQDISAPNKGYAVVYLTTSDFNCRDSAIALAGARVCARSLRCGRVPVEQAIDEGAECGLRMAAVRIIEKETGARQRPAGEDARKSSARERLADAIVVVGVENPEPLQGRLDHHVLVIGD